MGYRRQPTVYRLVFEEYEGLEVTARSVSVEELLKITGLANQMTAKPDDKQVGELFGFFATPARLLEPRRRGRRGGPGDPERPARSGDGLRPEDHPGVGSGHHRSESPFAERLLRWSGRESPLEDSIPMTTASHGS